MNKLAGFIKETLCAAAFLFVFSFACINSISNASAAPKSLAQLQSDYLNGSSFTKSYKNKAWQCHAFACRVGEAYAGSDPYTWSKKYNLDSLKPGDIIRCSRPHSIIVTSVSGNTITYADSNWVGRNIVKWNQTITRSRVTSKFGSLSYVMSAPHVGYTASGSSQEKPSIGNVGIDSIDYSHVKFHFTAGNSGLVRIVARSRDTGKSATRDYTSGLGYVTAEFNISEFPGTTEMEILIYAYTGRDGGNETLHRLTYGNTVGVVQLPEGNGTIAGFCFDYVFYADNNPDLKEKYGYDEQKLREHWLTFGIAEGRAGSPAWDGKYYLQANQDVAALCQGNIPQHTGIF